MTVIPFFTGNKSHQVKEKQLETMNICEHPSGCALIYGSNYTKCYYFINKKYIQQAKEILVSIGKRINKCNEISTASGVVCHNNKCLFGEGDMMDAITW